MSESISEENLSEENQPEESQPEENQTEEEITNNQELPPSLSPQPPVRETPLTMDEEETQEISGMPGMSAGIEDAEMDLAVDDGADFPASPQANDSDASLPDDYEPIDSIQEMDALEPDAPEPSPYFPDGTYQGAQQSEEYYDYSDTTPLYEPFERKPDEKRILGMTAVQRFFVVLMLLLVILVLGSFFLLISGKIVLPFI